MPSSSKPDISVVLPVLNGERFIKGNLERLLRYLSATHLSFEVIVVDDGSSDGTAQAVKSLAWKQLKLVSHGRNKGKYAALVTGMAKATGRCRVFTDADLPFELESLPYLHSLVVGRNFHLVVGDRTLPQSNYHQKLGLLRRLATRLFSFSIRMLVTGGLFDPQCGLKGFREDAADALFPLLRERGFGGDVEILYVALKYNLEIKRIPVRFSESTGSTVSVIRHGVPMLMQAMKLPRRWKAGMYRSTRLEELGRQDYWEREEPTVLKNAV